MRALSYREALSASFALHAALFFAARSRSLPSFEPPPIEIDLSTPFFGTGPAKLGAPKRLDPAARPGPALPAEEKSAVEPAKSVQAPKEFTLPGPQTEKTVAPEPPASTPGGAESGIGTSPLPGGAGAGADYGTPGGTGTGGSPLRGFPRLLNRDEVLANLRRFYPERERQMGREGSVLVKILINSEGKVADVEVARSAGPLFDEAARQVARLMRFSPAIGMSGAPVPVKLPQEMVFRLED